MAGLFFAKRALSTTATIAAKTGDENDVPPRRSQAPRCTTQYFVSALSETSATPRPGAFAAVFCQSGTLKYCEVPAPVFDHAVSPTSWPVMESAVPPTAVTCGHTE